MSRNLLVTLGQRAARAGALVALPELDFEERRKRTLYAGLIVPGVAILLSFGVYHLLNGNLFEGVIDCAAGAWLLGALVALRFVSRGLPIYRVTTALLGAVFIVLAARGGAYAGRIFWSFSFPLIAYYTLGKRRGAVWTGVLFAILVTVLYVSPGPALAYPTSFKVRFCVAFLLVVALTHVYEAVRDRSQRLLEDERNKLAAETAKLAALSATLQGVNRALGDSERRLKRAQALAHVGNLELDLRSGTAWGSEEALRLLGMDPARAEFPVSALEVLVPELPHLAAADEAQVREVGEAGLELDARRADGSAVTFHATIELVRSAEGAPERIVAVIQDVSERKRAEEERVRLQERLARSQKMEALGLLAGGVAHDLNNVLSGIVTLPDALLAELPDDDDLREPLAVVRDSGTRAAEIVQDLLTLARRGVTNRTVVDLNAVVGECLASPQHLKLQAAFPHVRFEVDLDPDLLGVEGSPVHLRTTLLNLLSNAAEAMPAGGRVHVRTVHRAVARDGEAPAEWAVIRVEDEGIGISPQDRDRIFEPFYTRKRMGRSGTGLGMAVVWGTVQDHQGQILVESAEGRGTAIELSFPATRAAAARARRVAIDEYVGRGETILVVDDVVEQRDLATRILAKLNYVPYSVASGEAAVAFLAAHPVDLVVLDMIMEPGIDGLETYRRVLRERPEQRALVVSGFSETDRVREAQRLGATGYVRKPYSLEALGLAVRQALDDPRPHRRPASDEEDAVGRRAGRG